MEVGRETLEVFASSLHNNNLSSPIVHDFLVGYTVTIHG
jgi:hypothetical protein